MAEISNKMTYPSESTKWNNIPDTTKKTTTVQSIFRATSILQCIIKGFHSIKDIAMHCELSISTAHRIIRTLEEAQLVFQDPVSRKYYLGPLFNRMILSQISAHQYLIAQAAEEVNRIWELFGEFTALDIQLGLQEINLMSLQSRFSYGVIRAPGVMFYGSSSKMLFSQISDREIEIILDCVTPRPASERCVTDKGKLMEQFREARRQGYYVSKEFFDGRMGISVSVKKYFCPAALSVSGPEERLDPIVLKVVEEMQKSANRIADNISKSD